MTKQDQKNRFLEALRKLGGAAGNAKLRDTLGWSEGTYNSVKQDLIDEGALTPGRGRGGSVSLIEKSGAGPAPTPRTRTNIAARVYSGCRPRRAGRI